jgi:predicted O-linked N-acetylglucosamine transferase (SPINDLY family)
VFLDNHHVNAHTTASEALWHAVPVVTWPGEALASRVAASLLLAAGAVFTCFTSAKVQILAKRLPLASPPR